MTKEIHLQKMREKGLSDAKALQAKAIANKVTQTEIIDQEDQVPAFNPTKDYSSWKVNSPVKDEGQVWLLLQPYNAANHKERPSDLRALWGLAHTKNPQKAKPWVAPLGVSGLYQIDECCIENGIIWRCKQDNNEFAPSAVKERWEKIGPVNV